MMLACRLVCTLCGPVARIVFRAACTSFVPCAMCGIVGCGSVCTLHSSFLGVRIRLQLNCASVPACALVCQCAVCAYIAFGCTCSRYVLAYVRGLDAIRDLRGKLAVTRFACECVCFAVFVCCCILCGNYYMRPVVRDCVRDVSFVLHVCSERSLLWCVYSALQ